MYLDYKDQYRTEQRLRQYSTTNGALVKFEGLITHQTDIKNYRNLGNMHKITSVFGEENVPSGASMTHRCESQREAAMPTFLLTQTTTLFGTWNVRTMYEAGKAAQIDAERTTNGQ